MHIKMELLHQIRSQSLSKSVCKVASNGVLLPYPPLPGAHGVPPREQLQARRAPSRHPRNPRPSRVLLSRKLSSALADRRKAAAQSVDLAAKLAVVQKQLQDATDEKDEMAIIVEEAWKMATEQRELRELASASAGTCKLILDDARSTSSRELSRSN